MSGAEKLLHRHPAVTDIWGGADADDAWYCGTLKNDANIYASKSNVSN